jgi:RimJ/RimL family protein N-acetyltransferase
MAVRLDPPYVVRTPRLLLRCWEPRDAPLAGEAIAASLDHLRTWMPWAHDEPIPGDERIALLRTFRGRFDLGQDFIYGIFEPDGSRVIGGTGLHTRVGDEAFEIGYWIRADAVGRGYATEAAGALTRVGLELCSAQRIEIHVDPGNSASLAVPRKLGFVEEGMLRRRLPATDPLAPRRDVVVFSLLADELAASPAAAIEVEAEDAAGRAVG